MLFAEWETSPTKARLSSNAIDAGFKIRPNEKELKEMGPEFNELWDRYFKDKPDKPVMFGSIVAGAYADHALLPPGKYITMFQYLEYPASRGKVKVPSRVKGVGDADKLCADPRQVGEPVCGAVLRQRLHEQQGRLRAYPLELQGDA